MNISEKQKKAVYWIKKSRLFSKELKEHLIKNVAIYSEKQLDVIINELGSEKVRLQKINEKYSKFNNQILRKLMKKCNEAKKEGLKMIRKRVEDQHKKNDEEYSDMLLNKINTA